jgi:hypothetical protein
VLALAVPSEPESAPPLQVVRSGLLRSPGRSVAMPPAPRLPDSERLRPAAAGAAGPREDSARGRDGGPLSRRLLSEYAVGHLWVTGTGM